MTPRSYVSPTPTLQTTFLQFGSSSSRVPPPTRLLSKDISKIIWLVVLRFVQRNTKLIFGVERWRAKCQCKARSISPDFVLFFFLSLPFFLLLLCPTHPPLCPSAGPQRAGGHQLQPEAEGEVPAPPADPAHRSSPTPAQEPLPPDQGAAGYERGSSQEVRAN